VLDRLAFVKHVLIASGNPRKYVIIPIVPGTFEMALMMPDKSMYNTWHREFSALFERLFETGFLAHYARFRTKPLHVLPVARLVPTLHQAWPSDHFDQLLEPFHDFAIGQCQCRLAMQLVGKGCGKPTMNCSAIGPMARTVIDRGLMRRASREELISVKREAEEAGCVTWLCNEVGDHRGNGSCSCCGCCCHALRMVSQFNAPGVISAPHFRPVMDSEKCISCKKCSTACPTQAWTLHEGSPRYAASRCIGCGLCVVACPTHALELEPSSMAETPEQGWVRLVLKMMPEYVLGTARTWFQRLVASDPQSRNP
jgi:Na+-translocating ferredoxin:NAD+ oxidoreductase subunit B